MQAAHWAVAALLWVNAITYAVFVYDKYSARRNARRVSEATLLQLAFWGGSPAAKLAQIRLRHKTRKQPFGRRLNAIVAVQVLALIVVPVLFWSLVAGRWSLVAGRWSLVAGRWSPVARQALADGVRSVLP